MSSKALPILHFFILHPPSFNITISYYPNSLIFYILIFSLLIFYSIFIFQRYDNPAPHTAIQQSVVSDATFGVINPVPESFTSPLGQVPVLEFNVDSGPTHSGLTHSTQSLSQSMSQTQSLSQSLAILGFLDDLYPTGLYGDQHPLIPDDPLLKSRVREIADIVTSGIQPLQSIGILRHVKVADVRGISDDGNAFARWKTEDGLVALEKLLAQMRTTNIHSNQNPNLSHNQSPNLSRNLSQNLSGNLSQNQGQGPGQSHSQSSTNIGQVSTVSTTLFAVGTTYPTLADLCLIPQLYNARYRLHIPVNDVTYPHLTAVERLCETLSCFQQAAPHNQPDAVNVL